MEELAELKQKLTEERPSDWENLPDIGLYMDQVISYMPRQLISFADAEGLTPAMVNNYIKDGLLPRADGKKYNRGHLAYLTAICALKQVLSVREIRALLSSASRQREPEELYELFRGELDESVGNTAEALDADTPKEELARLALRLALRSYANKLACERILDLIAPPEPKPERKRKAREPKE